MTADLDTTAAIRNALVGDSEVVSLLAAYKGDFPVFTRRPVPSDAPYPMLVISPDVAVSEQDGVDDFRPVVIRDIIAYGQNDTSGHYRAVHDLAYSVRKLFHGNRQSLLGAFTNYELIDVRASGPRAAPTDDDQTVGRLVEITIRLAMK